LLKIATKLAIFAEISQTIGDICRHLQNNWRYLQYFFKQLAKIAKK
jgi:hypothetical protein